MKRLIEVGFWRSEWNPAGATPKTAVDLLLMGAWFLGRELMGRPDPRKLVDPAWDPKQRDAVVKYLKSVPLGMSYMGHSTCRFCGKDNGSCDVDDGVYVWPEGFAHYLEEHHVRPPEEF